MKIFLTCILLFLLTTSFTQADTPTDEDKTIQVSNQLLQATVKLDPNFDAEGSGFFIAKNTILTNEHVIHNADATFKFKTYNGSICTAKVGYREENTDLALLKTDCSSEVALNLNEKYKIGQTVIIAGNPRDFDFTVTKGIVSAVNYGLIQMDARVNFGSSGGVAADMNGEVIGIVSKMSKSQDYLSFAIPSAEIKKFLQRAGG